MAEAGISAYASYIPYWRLAASSAGQVLGTRGGKVARAVASYDEDTTTMAIEAARAAVGEHGDQIGSVVLASANLSYADKTNATAIHAALDLDRDVRAADAGGSMRSGIGALMSAFYQPAPALVALADTRTGPAGSPDETGGGDAAAAFVLGAGLPDAALIATLRGTGSATAEFLDRWRTPGAPFASSWEERFGEEVYVGLAGRSFENALKDSGLAGGDITTLLVAGLSPRAAKRFIAQSTVSDDAPADDLTAQIGNTGTAHPGVLLAGALDDAQPGDVIALTVLADGADTLLLQVTDAITARRQPRPLAEQIAAGDDSLSYADFLTWKGQLQRVQPRRPAPDRAVAPASYRRGGWKFGFSGSTCENCGTRHLPPQRVCLSCGQTDRMREESMTGVPAKIATYTLAHLAFSLAPPTVGVILDFEGGGRFACELTDCDPAAVRVGMPVEMTFRKISDAAGIHNYFWKARPVHQEGNPS